MRFFLARSMISDGNHRGGPHSRMRHGKQHPGFFVRMERAPAISDGEKVVRLPVPVLGHIDRRIPANELMHPFRT
jgi:hypothetical protein